MFFLAFVASMGGLMFGFDIAIISGAVPYIQPYFGWNELQLGWGVSSLLVGAIIGAFGSGIMTEKFGLKRFLVIVALLFVLTCLASAIASRSAFFISARYIGGAGTITVMALTSFLQWLITSRYVPETKGKSLEEIKNSLK